MFYILQCSVVHCKQRSDTLNKNINAALLFMLPFFMSWTQRSKTFSIYTKDSFLSNIGAGYWQELGNPVVYSWMLLIRHVYDTYTSACQYPATSHSHWRGVDQHSTDHNQQPDHLYAKEMCCTLWGKWWSHQILTGFQTPPLKQNCTSQSGLLLWPV